METNFLKLYMDANRTLAKTLVVKSQTSIDSINDYIKLMYGESIVNPYDPTSWKYYLNVSGNYHNLDTDMIVTSLDTLEDIVFSKENLVVHTATKKAYGYGSRYYQSLVSKYPNQEQLILGILYPCDITTAINADDGSILSYPSQLVEPQELTLIDDLEGFIKRYLVRWNVSAFGLVDELYNTAQHAMLYLSILPKLLNLRLKRCHTNEVHSFHVREYLASHGKLDIYLPYLTLKQSLFLYRNLRYIERHSGRTEQFSILIEKLLSDRRIPINDLSIRQLSEFTGNYYNLINIRRKPLNPQFNVPEQDYFDLPHLFTKEIPLVYGNQLYFDNNENVITHSLQSSYSSVMQSKDLESSMLDYNNSLLDTLEDVLLRQWAFMSNKGLYSAVINFKDPKSLITRQLNAEDAFIYMLYISLKSININMTVLPNFINLKQRKLILPTVSELLSVVNDQYNDLTDIAIKLISDQPQIIHVASVDNFFNLNSNIYEQAFYHWFLVSNTHDINRRSYIQQMIYKLYEDEELILNSSNIDIEQWLFTRNLPTYNYSYVEAQSLVKEIFSKATGLTTDNTKLLANIQKALISILSQLSSYSIQFITEINKSKISIVPWAAIRTGDVITTGEQEELVKVNIRVLDSYGSSKQTVNIEADNSKNFENLISISQSVEEFIDTKLTLVDYISASQTIDVYFNSYDVTAEYDLYDPVVSDNSLFIGYEYYLALTSEQQSSIKSIYN